MPLQPVDGPARDEGRDISFPMTNGLYEARCYVQLGALDSIEQARTENAADRLARFENHRVMFEAVASDLYDAGLPLRITADHVRMLRRITEHRRHAGS